MLNAVLRELNNYFIRYVNGVLQFNFSIDITFTASDTLTGDFTDTFISGEYILIQGSRVNDGVYKINTISATELKIDAAVDILIENESEVTCSVTKLYIPEDLIQLIDKIDMYNTNVTTGISSESQGSRSVSYGTSGGGSSSGWKDAFNSQLSTYKKLRWC